ncbi:TonB-dependent receptor [candidate division KSB1 bacterium]|nr:TonB-dependent receptor [candidate division KSB1 bacterium]
MHTLKSIIFILLVFCLISQPLLQAQTKKYAQLKGTVKSSETSEPLPGVNIIVVGTVLGTTTDLEGVFTLNKIPVGTYQIKATMMGFKPQIKSVTTILNQAVILDFKLDETVIETPALVVTASKRRQSIQDSPTSLSVMTSHDIERLNEPYLDQALKTAPGVHFAGSNINIRGSSGFSRGAGSRVLLLVDGIPMMPGDSGDIKWDVIPVGEVKQVEIVKGAGSALYGSYALGGIVNVITKDPSPEPQTSIRLASGIYDKPYWPEWRWTDRTLHFNQMDFSHSRSINKLNFLISANKRQDTGYSQNGDLQTWSTLGKIRYSFTPETYLILNGRWTYRKAGEVVLWKNQHDALMIPEEAINQRTTSTKLNLNSIFRQVVNQKFAYKVQAAYLCNWFNTSFVDRIERSTGNDLRIESQFDLEPWEKHSVTTGSEVIFDIVESTLFGNHRAYGWAIYLQDEFKFAKNFALTSGIRFDFHHIVDLKTDTEWSPKIGLVYRPTPITAIRLSAGEGFRAPTMAEMFTSTIVSGFRVVPNEDLKAEHSWSYEIGLNQPLRENIYFDLAVFSTDYWDLIEGQPDQSLTITFQNLTRARISGAEVSFKTSWFNRMVGLDVGYTFMEPRDLTLKKTLAYRPRHLATVGFNFNYGIVGFNVDYQYNSRLDEVLIYPDDDRVAKHFTDAKLAFNWQHFQLSFDADNIFQYNYTTVERNLAPIRKFMVTLSSTF